MEILRIEFEDHEISKIEEYIKRWKLSGESTVKKMVRGYREKFEFP